MPFPLPASPFGVRPIAMLAALLLPINAAADLAILQYHHIADDTPASTSTSPSLFEKQLDQIQALGLKVVPLEVGTEQVLEGEASTGQSVALTFDDAYSSVYETAWPILKERGLPFTLFVNTDAIDQGTQGYMTWDQIRELGESALVSIGNHTSDHAHLVAMPGEADHQLRERVEASLDDATTSLRENLDQEPRLFAYPYGEYSKTVQNLVRERQWLGFGQQSGPIGVHSDPSALPRFPASNAYGALQGLKDKLRSRAFPIDASALPASPITTNPPQLMLKLPDDWQLARLSCFASGQGRIQVRALEGGEAEVQAGQPFDGRRARYNCTYPAADGRFYWLSQPWVNPGEQEG